MAAFGMAAASGTAAEADEFGTRLRALLTNPPAGFVALHGERKSQVWPRWTAKPFIANATCEVIGSDDGPDAELRCVVNEKAAPEVTKAYFDSTRAEIERCLASLPDGGSFKRADARKNADGFEGSSSNWSYRSKTGRFEIELTNDSVFGAARNSFSVRYQKL